MSNNTNYTQLNAEGYDNFKEAVCIDVSRIYDSCSDKC